MTERSETLAARAFARAAIAPGAPVDPERAAGWLLEQDDAPQIVRRAPADQLYALIREAGWEAGSEIALMAKPEQLQRFVDLDAWRRDDFVPARLDPWIATLVSGAEDDAFVAAAREIDAEVLALYLQDRIAGIWELEEGAVPDEAPDGVELTPDGVYALLYAGDEDRRALSRAFIARLYELDRVLAWTLIEAVRWELPAPMQEYALRWRWSRLEEYGFVDRDEARRVYLPLRPDRLAAAGRPAPIEADDAPHLPTVIASELGDEFAVARALTETDPEGRRLGELGALLNRALVADGVEPGEPRAGRQAARRALGYMSLGLIYAAGSSDRAALARAIKRAALGDLLRVGHTAAAALARQAALLTERPALTIIEGMDYSLLSDTDAALFEGLARRRPTYAAPDGEPELFCEVAQIEECAARLGRIASLQLWLFSAERVTLDELVGLAQRPELLSEPYEVNLETLGTSWLARAILGEEPRFEPLGAPELARAADASLDEASRERAAFALAQSASTLPAQASALLEEWARGALLRLREELSPLAGQTPDPALLSSLLLTRS